MTRLNVCKLAWHDDSNAFQLRLCLLPLFQFDTLPHRRSDRLRLGPFLCFRYIASHLRGNLHSSPMRASLLSLALLAARFASPVAAEEFKYESDIARLMKIVVGNLYESRDVWVRELRESTRPERSRQLLRVNAMSSVRLT